jgi:hypothetical protein
MLMELGMRFNERKRRAGVLAGCTVTFEIMDGAMSQKNKG